MLDNVKIPEALPSVETKNLSVKFNGRDAIRNVNIEFKKNKITSIIGPSGCGKSTLLRSINFMNQLIPGCRVTGKIFFEGEDISGNDAVEVRRKIGMVFQKPNPFPTMSIRDNVIAGLKMAGSTKKNIYDEIIERSLIQAGLWNEVKDRLKVSALELSGGQQQRLCIARTLAVSPQVILMDEPTSALDPISTMKIEETIHDLKSQITIAIVTHNMQQAARLSDITAFMYLGEMIEIGKTSGIFVSPVKELTEQYVTGRFG
ncbi:MAG TPA: phosphate ABC transporter ATP-binding protein PstB [Ignavibacteria bacterium]|nr:phosphate ABC transporter ATP-binding protein PstB [Ignavibacteria bacterium]